MRGQELPTLRWWIPTSHETVDGPHGALRQPVRLFLRVFFFRNESHFRGLSSAFAVRTGADQCHGNKPTSAEAYFRVLLDCVVEANGSVRGGKVVAWHTLCVRPTTVISPTDTHEWYHIIRDCGNKGA